MAREFATHILSRCGEQVRAVYAVGSLATGSYRPGRSDIDTVVIVSDGCAEGTAATIRTVAAALRDAYGIPKGFGSVCIPETKLNPPYVPEEELVPEILRLLAHGRGVSGAYDLTRVKVPTADDFRAYAKVWYPWLRTNYVDRRPPEERTVDAIVNTLLYELRLAVWDARGEYVYAKPRVIPAFLDGAAGAALRADLERVQREYVLGDSEPPVAFVDDVLRRASGFVRAKVEWCR